MGGHETGGEARQSWGHRPWSKTATGSYWNL